MQKYDKQIKALGAMKKYPKSIYTKGDTSLLGRPKVSMVGSRKPTPYTREYTYTLAQSLAKRGVVVVSGAAMGVDAIAHQGAGASNTIAVMANSLDIRYPSINRGLIESIEREGLVMSQFDPTFAATKWSFVLRNELVVALGDILIITQADIDSGSMRSAEYAMRMGKEIFVLPHTLRESLGTNKLLTDGVAKPIYDVESFVSRFGIETRGDLSKDDFYYFCQKAPTLDEAIGAYGERIYEAELEGIITIENAIVRLA